MTVHQECTSENSQKLWQLFSNMVLHAYSALNEQETYLAISDKQCSSLAFL